MTTSHDGGPATPTDAELDEMTNEELVRLGTALDGVEVVHRPVRWPISGTRAEKRAERAVAFWFGIAGIAALAFVGVYLFWPWEYKPVTEDGHILYTLYTPLLGLTMGLAILGVGLGAITYTKKFIPDEVSVQDRHDGGSTEVDKRTATALLGDALTSSTIARRKVIKRSLGFGVGALGLMALMPLGGLVKNPWSKGAASALWTSGWTPTNDETIFLRRDTGRSDDVVLVRPEDLNAGALETVFPFRESERGDKEALSAALHASDNPVMLIRLRPDDGAKVIKRAGQEDFNYGDLYAYSKICTHLGCPVVAVPAADEHHPLPVPPVAVRHVDLRQAGVRASRPGAAPAAHHRQQGRVPGGQGQLHRVDRPGILGAQVMTSTQNRLAKVADGAFNDADDRYHLSSGLRRQINKVFPTHWSFLLGEIALYSFIILLLSGTYLTLFFDPSLGETTYNGSYQLLRGIEMSRAYETALDLSFDVRGGLFMRQMHHWAALLFMASIVVHMFRTFFTGAFRRPREANWIIGVLLLVLGIVEGFIGYSLPDDLLSGTGVRIMSAIILSIPVAGTWLHWLVFGGEFPGTIFIPRFYIAHVLLIPAILLALIAAHLALVWYQKHTQFPGPGRTEKNVVGVRILPVFAVKSGGFFAVTFGVLAVMSGLFQINPVWQLGPYNPSQVSAGSQPDWYMGFTDGIARIYPAWELYIGSHTIPSIVVPVLFIISPVFVLLMAYPFIERKFTGDSAHHNLLQRPRDVPVRTSLGAMSIAFYVVLLISGGNDLIAYHFDISLNAMTWIGRIGILVVPPIAYWVSYRFCLALQRSDREVLEHGVETGIIKRLPHGQFVEVHQPLGGVDAHGHAIPLEYQGAAVPKKMNKLGSSGAPAAGGLTRPDPPEETAALERAGHDEELAGRRALSGRPDAGRPRDERD